MCGISLAYCSSLEKRETFIYKGLDLISHRGNDEVGRVQFGQNLFLGHRRLKITGNRGRQPIIHNQIAVLTNGEFYDYESIKKEYSDFNYQTDTDAEILIPLYKKYGINRMMEHLNGEYAFVLVDHAEKQIFLVRDPVGNKPLYYYQEKNDLFVSSEIKSFKSIFKLQFDPAVLMQKLAMQYHEPKNTLFQDIKQVEPGKIVCFNYETGQLSVSTFFDLYKDKKQKYSSKKMMLLLKQSVARRIDKQNPAIALSGGLDSSIILDLVQEINPNIKNCFSISFKDGGLYDELELISILKKHYNVNVEVLSVSVEDLVNNFEESIYHAEDVAVNMHMSAKLLLFKEMKKNGFNVSLSGEGSDEFFLGYAHFFSDTNQYLVGMHLPDKKEEKYKDLPLFIQAKLAIGNRIQKFLKIKNNYFFKYVNIDNLSSVENASYLWSKMALSNSILLALGDKMEMASTIEGRTPFLDKDLLRYIMSIDIKDKQDQSIDKIILRNLFKDRLPKEIIQKKKHPFISPPLLETSLGINFYRKTLNEWKCDFIDHNLINLKLDELELLKNNEQNLLFDPVFMILSSIAILQKRMIDND